MALFPVLRRLGVLGVALQLAAPPLTGWAADGQHGEPAAGRHPAAASKASTEPERISQAQLGLESEHASQPRRPQLAAPPLTGWAADGQHGEPAGGRHPAGAGSRASMEPEWISDAQLHPESGPALASRRCLASGNSERQEDEEEEEEPQPAEAHRARPAQAGEAETFRPVTPEPEPAPVGIPVAPPVQPVAAGGPPGPAPAAARPSPPAGQPPAVLAPPVAAAAIFAGAPASTLAADVPAAAPVRERPIRTLIGVPDVVLPPGPEGQRVAVALFALPLLMAAWVWSVVRIASLAAQRRRAELHAALAHQLGIPPTVLSAVDAAELRRLTDQVAVDELTGVLRRAAGVASLERELARSRREAEPLSCVFVDVDGLKQTNDERGHAAGDELLRGVAGLLTHRLRGQDLVFRYGGDEFVCVLTGTGMEEAEQIAAAMRGQAEAAGLPFSYGVAQARPGEGAQALLDRADRVQYRDKRARKRARPTS